MKETEMLAGPSAEDFESLKWTVQFLSRRSRAFSLSEVQCLTDASFGFTLSTMLGNDQELMKLTSTEDEEWFIRRSTLARWLVYVNLRLSRIKVAQLTSQEWKRLLRTFRVECRNGTSRTAILEFGSSKFLAYRSDFGCRVVFPLAALLSDCTNCEFDCSELEGILGSTANSDAKQASVEGAVDRILDSHWDKRVIEIVRKREGLSGASKMTLAEVGLEYGVTRERIRQFESRFWDSLGSKRTGRKRNSKAVSERIKELFGVFLVDFAARGCSMVWKPPEQGFAHRMFLAKCLGITAHRCQGLDVIAIGPAAKALKDLHAKPFVPGLAAETQDNPRYIDPLALAQIIASTQECGLIDRDVKIIAESVADWRKNHLTKVQRVYLVLCHIGRPAHYSEITKTYNTMFPGDISSTRTIHAALSRYELGIVWVGRRGTFALSQWGYSRPEKSLHDAVTEIVGAEYRKTEQPVPTSVIHEKLQIIRGPINLNSLIFATEANEELRYVLGDSFVPKELSNAGNSKDYPQPRIEVAYSHSEPMVDRLSVSSLAGFGFSGKHQKNVVELGKRFSILELKCLIERGQGTRDLARLFKSKSMVLQADKAISQFQAITSSWVKGDKRDSRATWVLEADSVQANLSQQELLNRIEAPFRTLVGGFTLEAIENVQKVLATLETNLEAKQHDLGQTEETTSRDSRSVLELRRALAKMDWRQHFDDLELWMPFLSLELIQRLKSMKSNTFGALHRALIKSNRHAGLSDRMMPWSREFPSELASLPIHWLYQFDANSNFLKILTSLSSAHCTNIGHLVAIHPASLNSIRRFDHKFWTRLTIALKNQV